MKILQIVPRRGAKSSLKALLKAKERELRGNRTTFVRKGEGRWQHKRYGGAVNWEEVKGGVLIVEVRTREAEAEWQLLRSFIGYLDRHLSDHIESITILYR